MTSKISLFLIQTFFFFWAITFMSFFAEVIFLTSKGASFCTNYAQWIAAEFTAIKILLRIAASAIYVIFRNRRLFF